MSAYGNSDLDMAAKIAFKVVRSNIRLKHSVAADRELNDLLDRLDQWLAAQKQQGIIPEMSAEDYIKMLEGWSA